MIRGVSNHEGASGALWNRHPRPPIKAGAGSSRRALTSTLANFAGGPRCLAPGRRIRLGQLGACGQTELLHRSRTCAGGRPSWPSRRLLWSRRDRMHRRTFLHVAMHPEVIKTRCPNPNPSWHFPPCSSKLAKVELRKGLLTIPGPPSAREGRLPSSSSVQLLLFLQPRPTGLFFDRM